MCTRMHAGIVCALCMCVHMGACVHTEYSSAGAEKCVCTCTCVCACGYAHVCMCTCVCTCECVHTEYASSAEAEKCRHRMRPTRLRSDEDTVCL